MSRLTTTFGTLKDLGPVDVSPYENIVYDPVVDTIQPAYFDDNLRPSWAPPQDGLFDSVLTRAHASTLPDAEGFSATGVLGQTYAQTRMRDVLTTGTRFGNANFDPVEQFNAWTNEVERSILDNHGYNESWMTSGVQTRGELMDRIKIAKFQSRNEAAMTAYQEDSFLYLSESAQRLNSVLFNHLVSDPTTFLPLGVAGKTAKVAGTHLKSVTAARLLTVGAGIGEGAAMGGLMAENMEEYNASILHNEGYLTEGLQTGGILVGGLIGMGISSLFLKNLGGSIQAKETRRILDDLEASLPEEVSVTITSRNSNLTPARAAKASSEDLFVHHIRQYASQAESGLQSVVGAISSRKVLQKMGITAEEMYYWILTKKPSASEVRTVLTGLNDEANAAREKLFAWRSELTEMHRQRNYLREKLANDPGLTEANINRSFVAERIRAMFGSDFGEVRMLLDERVMAVAGFRTMRDILKFLDTNPSKAEVNERLTYVWKQAAKNTSKRARSIAKQQKEYSKWVSQVEKYLDQVEEWTKAAPRGAIAKVYQEARAAAVAIRKEMVAANKVRSSAERRVKALTEELEGLKESGRSGKKILKIQQSLDEAAEELTNANKVAQEISERLVESTKGVANAQRRGASFGMTKKNLTSRKRVKVPVAPETPPAARSSVVPQDKAIVSPTTRFTDALKERDEITRVLEGTIISKKGRNELTARLEALDKYIKRGESRIARTGRDASAPWVALQELEEKIIQHQQVRYGQGNFKSNLQNTGLKPDRPVPGTASERFATLKTRYIQLIENTSEGGAILRAIEETEKRIVALTEEGNVAGVAAAEATLKGQRAHLAGEVAKLEQKYNGKAASVRTEEEVRETAMRNLFEQPTSGTRADGTVVTAREGADVVMDQMEANLSAGVVNADPHAIGAFLDSIPGLSRAYKGMRWLSTQMGVAGTGAQSTILSGMPIVNMLARLIDTGGIRVVDDLGKKGAVMFSATEFSRQAKAWVEPFILLVKKHEKAVKSRPQIMNDLRTHRLNGTRFADDVEYSKELNELLHEWNRILDRTGEVLKEAGLITIKDGERYIPGGIHVPTLLADKDKWIGLLAKKFSENVRKSDRVNGKVAKAAGIDAEAGSNVLLLSESDKALYFSHIDKTMEEQARESLLRAVGGVDDDLSHGTRGVDRTERQRFGTDILTDSELAPLFEHNLAAWMDTYARRTMTPGLFNRQLAQRFGTTLNFDDLVDAWYKKFRHTVDNPDDLKVIAENLKQKHRWVMGTMAEDSSDRIQNALPRYLAELGTRLTRAAFSPAWGIPVGTMELPAAVLQQGGSSPIQIGRNLVTLMKGMRSHRNRLDMFEALGIVTDHMRVNFRYLNSYGDGVTGAISLGFVDRFAGHWRHFKDVWSGNIYRPYGSAYGNAANRVLAGVDALGAAGQQLGGMEMATELVIAVTAQAQLQWLRRNFTKMGRMVDLLEKHGDALSKMDPKERSAAFKHLVKEAGFGGDHRLVAELNGAGLLRRDVYDTMAASMKESGGVVDLRALAQRSVGGDEAASTAHQGLGQYIGNRIQEASPVSTAMTTNTAPPSVGNILFNFFMTFPRAWYARNIQASARSDNEQLMYLGTYYVMETVHRGLRDIVYKDKNLDDVVKEWEDDPAGKATDTLAGVPFLGAMGPVVNSAVGAINEGGSSTNVLGSNSIVNQTYGKWLKSIHTVKNAITEGSISSKDAADGVRLFSVTGAWWQWATLKGVGWSPYESGNK